MSVRFWAWRLSLGAALLAPARLAAHVPHDVIRALAVSPDFERDRTLFHINAFAGSDRVLLRSTDGGRSWKPLARGLDNVYSLTSVAAGADRALYLSTHGDGVYRSGDGGETWSKANSGLEDLRVAFLAVSPVASSAAALAAAGGAGGLHLSRDGGGTWKRCLSNRHKIKSVAFSPNPGAPWIFAGDARGGLFVSKDGGRGWERLFRFKGAGPVTAIALALGFSAQRGVLFVGTGKRGMWKSEDGGRSFSEVNGGIPDMAITSVVALPGDSAQPRLMASAWRGGVFVSDDAGGSWQPRSDGLTTNPQADEPDYRQPQFSALAVSPAFARDQAAFLAGFEGLFRTDSAGRHWTELETLAPGAVYGFDVSRSGRRRDIAVATHYSGAWHSRDDEAAWEPLPLDQKHLMDAAFPPAGAADGALFLISNNAFYRLSTQEGRYEKIALRDPRRDKALFPFMLAVSPDFASDRTLFFGTRYSGVFKSTDGGRNWTGVLKAKGKTARIFAEMLALSPRFGLDGTLFASVRGEKRIYKTMDAGGTWKAVYSGSGRVMGLAVSPAYGEDGTVFAGCLDGLFRSGDGGRSWARIPVVELIPHAPVAAVALSPEYRSDRMILVSLKGRGLFKSEDRGASFAEVAPSLIAAHHDLRRIRFSPDYGVDRAVYGATFEALFQSRDGGMTWFPLPGRAAGGGASAEGSPDASDHLLK